LLSPGTLISSSNKTDIGRTGDHHRFQLSFHNDIHDVTDILLKVALKIANTLTHYFLINVYQYVLGFTIPT